MTSALLTSALALVVATGAGTVSAPPDESRASSTLSTRERAGVHWRAGVGVDGLGGALITAGWSHVTGTPEAWNQTAGGFGRRYASAVGSSAVDHGVRFAVGAALGQDPRYHRRGTGGFFRRVAHAAGAVVVTRDRSGRVAPAWYRWAGAYGSGAVSAIWYPRSGSVGRHVAEQGTMSLGGDFLALLWEEFSPDVARIFRK